MSQLDILYVDDDDDIRTIVELALGMDPDIRLEAMSSAEMALDRLREWSPHVVLLDVMMPGMDGPTMLAQLREPPVNDTPVIFMTAKGRDADIAHYQALGAIGIVRKPFDPMRLANDIRQILGVDI